MLSRYTRESARVLLDNQPITGLQSINSSYNLPFQNIKYLGQNDSLPQDMPIGPYLGAINFESILLNKDQFIKYTGDISADLRIEYDNNAFLMNKGYMAEYTLGCDVGSIPSVNTKWNIYGDFGSGNYQNSPFNIDESKLNIINPGDINISLNELDLEKINSFAVSIRSTRLPIYDATSRIPVDIKLQYPIQILTSFSISLNEYKQKNLYDYPKDKHIYNIGINLNKHNTNQTISSFQFNNSTLIAEDYSVDINGSILMKLSYNNIINRIV